MPGMTEIMQESRQRNTSLISALIAAPPKLSDLEECALGPILFARPVRSDFLGHHLLRVRHRVELSWLRTQSPYLPPDRGM